MGVAYVGNGEVEKQYLCFKLGENAAGTFELLVIILHSR
jgi:hypothetical protein